jgi:acetyltransferase-like isoleucine patch superfamily enzyme
VSRGLVDPSAVIHPLAVVEPGARIGARTRVWAFAHLLPGAVVGADGNVCDHTFVEGRVVVGDRVTLKCGVFLWDGLVIEDDVFVGPNATFTNDPSPRSRHHRAEFPRTLLKEGCSIGANATVLPGLTIGRYAMVGAGAVVTRDVPDQGLVAGRPARLRGFVCRCGGAVERAVETCARCAGEAPAGR